LGTNGFRNFWIKQIQEMLPWFSTFIKEKIALSFFGLNKYKNYCQDIFLFVLRQKLVVHLFGQNKYKNCRLGFKLNRFSIFVVKTNTENAAMSLN
jgi:hypothetical protein